MHESQPVETEHRSSVCYKENITFALVMNATQMGKAKKLDKTLLS